ncbi:hypothetical protein P3S67_020951 [Capsicum chacoense]
MGSRDVGPECCEKPTGFELTERTGSVLEIGGFNTYVSRPPTSKHAILFVSDVYGYEAPNLREACRQSCSCRILCGVPDFLCGDPYTTDKPLSIWIQSHGTEKGLKMQNRLLQLSRIEVYLQLELQGFAGVVTRWLLSLLSLTTFKLQCYCTIISQVDDMKEVKAPIAILAAEIDKFLLRSLLSSLRRFYHQNLRVKDPTSDPSRIGHLHSRVRATGPVYLGDIKVDKFVKIFPSAKHGWTVRYNVEDKEAVQQAEEAHQDMLDWLTKQSKNGLRRDSASASPMHLLSVFRTAMCFHI